MSIAVFLRLLDPYWTRGVSTPRTIRDASLESRTARSRLKAHRKPYYRLLESGLHLGYRKLKRGPGNWLVRRYQGEGYRLRNIGPADDYDDADGHGVFNFAQAQARARAEAAAKRGPCTVGQALDAYFTGLEAERRSPRSIGDARTKAAALILPSLAPMPVSDLTAPLLPRWRDSGRHPSPRPHIFRGRTTAQARQWRGCPTRQESDGQSRMGDLARGSQCSIPRWPSAIRYRMANGEAVCENGSRPHTVPHYRRMPANGER